MSRTSLETQKLDLIDEVSFLKLKLVSMEETHSNSQPNEPADTDQKKAEVWTPYRQESAFFDSFIIILFYLFFALKQ